MLCTSMHFTVTSRGSPERDWHSPLYLNILNDPRWPFCFSRRSWTPNIPHLTSSTFSCCASTVWATQNSWTFTNFRSAQSDILWLAGGQSPGTGALGETRHHYSHLPRLNSQGAWKPSFLRPSCKKCNNRNHLGPPEDDRGVCSSTF